MQQRQGQGQGLEGKGPQTRVQQRLDRRLEEGAKAVGGGYCRLQMPLKLALAVRETVAGHRQGGLEGGGGTSPPPMHRWPRGGGSHLRQVSVRLPAAAAKWATWGHTGPVWPADLETSSATLRGPSPPQHPGGVGEQGGVPSRLRSPRRSGFASPPSSLQSQEQPALCHCV